MIDPKADFGFHNLIIFYKSLSGFGFFSSLVEECFNKLPIGPLIPEILTFNPSVTPFSLIITLVVFSSGVVALGN